jgi:hypothetical protein
MDLKIYNLKRNPRHRLDSLRQSLKAFGKMISVTSTSTYNETVFSDTYLFYTDPDQEF